MNTQYQLIIEFLEVLTVHLTKHFVTWFFIWPSQIYIIYHDYSYNNYLRATHSQINDIQDLTVSKSKAYTLLLTIATQLSINNGKPFSPLKTWSSIFQICYVSFLLEKSLFYENVTVLPFFSTLLMGMHICFPAIDILYTDISSAIMHLKKLLDSGWLRAVQFKCNTSSRWLTSCSENYSKDIHVSIPTLQDYQWSLKVF